LIIKAIPSTWLIEEQHRLDCGPFVNGGIEARKTIERLRYPKNHLVELTKGAINGMYHVGQDKIMWAENSIHGMPFLGSSDILKADLSYQPFISRKQVTGNYLFQCPVGSTLITRSGTIGRMAYMRTDMEDAAISQDVLKVIPDEEKVKPGYLFALLSSKYGIPIITGGTFGSIIVHIEAENIADFPVPRLGAIEVEVHDLIQQAANLRVIATKAITEAIEMMERMSGLKRLSQNSNSAVSYSIRAVSSSNLLKRMDAGFYGFLHNEAIDSISSSRVGTIRVEEIAESIVEPKRFKRIQISDKQYGVRMFGTSALMWADPEPSFLIPKSIAHSHDLAIDQKTLLIPRSGQLSGIIGTAVLPFGKLIGGAVSEDAIRVRCKNVIDAGFLFVALRSEYGRRQLKARAYGSSIPHLDEYQIGQVLVPALQEKARNEIGRMGFHSSELRSQAINIEQEARALVERTIEAGGR
jgi:type I restriction enzyme, S subunit